MARTAVLSRSEPVYYGWYIVAASALIIFTSTGIGFYALPVFLDPLDELRGFDKSTVSLATTVYFAWSGIVAVPAGRLVDRRGPRPSLLVGCVIMAAALLLLGHAREVWHLFGAYMLMATGFAMMGGVAVNALITRWFIRKRARALSISQTGVSMGGVALVPLFTLIIDRWGFSEATTILAIMVVVGVVPITLLVLKDRPEDMGLLPDGEREPSSLDVGGALSYAAQTTVWKARDAVSTGAFWAIAAGFTFMLLGQTGYLMHQISFLKEELGTSAAALAVSVTAGGSIVGRLAMGSVADRLNKKYVAIGCFLLQGLAMLLVIYTGNIVGIYLGTLVVGLTIGNIYMMQSLLVGESFGMVSFGAVFGLIALLSQSLSSVGPAFVGLLESATGGYTVPLTITAGLSLLAALSVSFLRPPVHPSKRAERQQSVAATGS